MLRITPIQGGNHPLVLRLEGRVAGPWVAELSNVCEELLAEGRPLQLDLADVSFMDPNGIALISGLRSRGVSLAACSPFLQEQLKDAAEQS